MNEDSDDTVSYGSSDAVLRAQLVQLRKERVALEEELAEMTHEAAPRAMAVARIKKRQLALEDQISMLEARLFPDILA